MDDVFDLVGPLCWHIERFMNERNEQRLGKTVEGVGQTTDEERNDHARWNGRAAVGKLPSREHDTEGGHHLLSKALLNPLREDGRGDERSALVKHCFEKEREPHPSCRCECSEKDVIPRRQVSAEEVPTKLPTLFEVRQETELVHPDARVFLQRVESLPVLLVVDVVAHDEFHAFREHPRQPIQLVELGNTINHQHRPSLTSAECQELGESPAQPLGVFEVFEGPRGQLTECFELVKERNQNRSHALRARTSPHESHVNRLTGAIPSAPTLHPVGKQRRLADTCWTGEHEETIGARLDRPIQLVEILLERVVVADSRVHDLFGPVPFSRYPLEDLTGPMRGKACGNRPLQVLPNHFIQRTFPFGAAEAHEPARRQLFVDLPGLLP